MSKPKGSTKAYQRRFAGDRLQLMRYEMAREAVEDAIPPNPIGF
jgi:hypothetical protein